MRKFDIKDAQAKTAGITGKVVSFMAKDLHFTFQTLADGVAVGEANIVHKLTGVRKKEIMNQRRQQTLEIQDNIKLNAEKLKRFAIGGLSTKAYKEEPVMTANPPQNSGSHE